MDRGFIRVSVPAPSEQPQQRKDEIIEELKRIDLTLFERSELERELFAIFMSGNDNLTQ